MVLNPTGGKEVGRIIFETNPLNQYIIIKLKNQIMQILIVLLIVLAASYLVKGIVDLLSKGKKEPEVIVQEVIKEEYPVILEEPLPTQELEKMTIEEEPVKAKVVKKAKPKAKSVKKEIAVKKEKKPKDKGNDMLLS